MKHAASFVLFGFLLGITTSSLSASVLGSNVFPDVPTGAYFDSAVGEMYSAGIITGYGDGRFGPNDYVTRGQIAVIMQRFRNDLLGITPQTPSSAATVATSSSERSVATSSSEEAASSAPSTVEATSANKGTFRFTSSTFSVDEGDGSATISIIRSGGSDGDVTVKYEAQQDTATAGLDFNAASGTLEFEDGQTNKTFSVVIKEDTKDEGIETIQLVLKNPGGGAGIGSPNTATLTITDNESSGGSDGADTSVNGVFNFSATEYRTPDNGDSILITVERTGGSEGQATVAYASAHKTATGNHYSSANGTLTFGNGETEKTFEVETYEDTGINGNKSFTLTLSNPTGGALLGTIAPATDVIIVDDEVSTFSAGTIELSEDSYTGSEFDKKAVIGIKRIGGADGEVTVEYRTNQVSALEGTDYTETTGTLTFRHGEAMKTIIVPILRDTVNDPNERFEFILSNPSGTTLGTPAAAAVTIP